MNESSKKALEAWDRCEVVSSIELGGIGPGYEQAIQILLFELLRDAGTPPAVGRPFDAWGEAAVARCQMRGFSGVQVGVAKSAAAVALRAGWDHLLQEAKDRDRLISVSRDWPHPPTPPSPETGGRRCSECGWGLGHTRECSHNTGPESMRSGSPAPEPEAPGLSEERLAELDRLASSGRPSERVGAALRDLLTEVRRLRAQLAASLAATAPETPCPEVQRRGTHWPLIPAEACLGCGVIAPGSPAQAPAPVGIPAQCHTCHAAEMGTYPCSHGRMASAMLGECDRFVGNAPTASPAPETGALCPHCGDLSDHQPEDCHAAPETAEIVLGQGGQVTDREKTIAQGAFRAGWVAACTYVADQLAASHARPRRTAPTKGT